MRSGHIITIQTLIDFNSYTHIYIFNIYFAILITLIFCNINKNNKVLINEQILDFMGYSGSNETKQLSFKRLLLKNSHIEHKRDKKQTHYYNSNTKYII